jgi:hypothetical protein
MYRDADGNAGFASKLHATPDDAERAARRYIARELGVSARSLVRCDSDVEAGGVRAVITSHADAGAEPGGLRADIIELDAP